MIKLIVSDLDGTLLDKSKQINERDRRAVRKAYESGLDLCIASGRMNAEITVIMRPFPNNYHAVGQNGATVRLNNERLLGAMDFAPELTLQLLQVVPREEFISFVHCTDDSYYARVDNEVSRSVENRIMSESSTHHKLEEALANDEFRCSKLACFGELGKLSKLEAQLNRQFPGQIETFISDKDCLDIMPLNVSKGTGISLLIRELGIAPHEIACIGDSFNDLSMFALTPHSFAMVESHDEIREQASTVVHSVAEAIEHIIAYNAMSVAN
ncbi:HAD family hydrolase [Paenibacillus glycanilyticus]|uniref:HAD family hydrolase n=1 Tax=Paenibacillus glycanilyticus TaxID=126569 RepID=UPI000FDA2797|nr:HAD family hydrolase [Paenibacillus glycanilyticus]